MRNPFQPNYLSFFVVAVFAAAGAIVASANGDANLVESMIITPDTTVYPAPEPPDKPPCDEPTGGGQAKGGFPKSSFPRPGEQKSSRSPGVSELPLGEGGGPGLPEPSTTFIAPQTGKLTRVEDDLFLRGVGLDFRIRRTYHSDHATYNSRFGAGWEMNTYRMFQGVGAAGIVGAPGNEPDKLLFTNGQGLAQASILPDSPNNHLFFADGSKMWVEYFDAASSVGGIESLVSYYDDGTTETYEQLVVSEEWFYLTKVEDMFGNVITLNYVAPSAGDPQGRVLDTVQDTIGREISFYYNADFRIETIEARMASGGPIIAQVDYAYNLPDASGFVTLKNVTGVKIATENSQGQLAMVRPVVEYQYWPDSGDGQLLKLVINGEKQVEHLWVYNPSTGGQVATQTDRPNGALRTSGEGIHEYTYTGNTTKHVDPDGGRTDYLIDSFGRVGSERKFVTATDFLETNYHFNTGLCSSCGDYSSVDYPDGSSTEFQYDDGGNLIAQWWHPNPNSAAPSRVERWKWSTFNPTSGLFKVNLLEHELVRDAHINEEPDNSCTSPSCQQSGNATGHVVHFFTWSDEIPNVLAAGAQLEVIDYGFMKTNSSGSTMLREDKFEYFANGLLKTESEFEGGAVVSRTNYLLSAKGDCLVSEEIEDVTNGGSWTTTFTVDQIFLNVTEETNASNVTTGYRWDVWGNTYQILEDYSLSGGSAVRTVDRRFDLAKRLVKSSTSGVGGIAEEVVTHYDETGLPYAAQVTGPSGLAKSAQLVFSKSGLLTKTVDWRGWVEETVYGYGVLHLPIEMKESLGGTTRTTWLAGDGVPGAGLHPGYDSMGRLLSWRDQALWKHYQIWDAQGNLGKLFNQTAANYYSGKAFKYDARGHLKEVEVGTIQGAPSTISAYQWRQHHVLEHNFLGYLLSQTVYESGAVIAASRTEYEVDGRGRVVQQSISQGDKGGGSGSVTAVVSDFVYDALDRTLQGRNLLAGIGSNPVKVVDYSYNELLQETTVDVTQMGSSMIRSRTVLLRNNFGLVETKTGYAWSAGTWVQPRTWLYEYDGLHRVIATQDPLGVREEWSLNDWNKVTEERTVPSDTSPTLTTTYAFSAADGTLTSVIDAEGGLTTYDYYSDWLNPQKVTYQDSRTFEILAYDSLDRPTETIDSRGVKHQYDFDYGYLKSDTAVIPNPQLVPGPDQLLWEYDYWKGTLTKSQVLESGSVVWETNATHNDLGEQLTETQGLGGNLSAWSWAYGYAGELRSSSYPSILGLDLAEFNYDGAGRLKDATYSKGGSNIAKYGGFEYSGYQLTGRTDSLSGIGAEFEYDIYGRMNKIQWGYLVGGGTTLLDGQERSLDLANRVTSRQRVLDSMGDVFIHDGYGRMKQSFKEVPAAILEEPNTVPSTYNGVEQFKLDAVYARDEVEAGPDLNSMILVDYSTNGAHFYDLVNGQARTSFAGYLNSDANYLYRYNAWGQLTEVEEKTSPNIVIRKHHYDAEGRRVLSEHDDGSVITVARFIYWGLRLAGSYIDNGVSSPTDVWTYGFLGGRDSEAFAIDGNTGNSYELARDFQGSILGLIDRTSKVVVERYRYSPFGEVSIEDSAGASLTSSAVGNNRFFLGRILDAEVKIYDLRNRWYDPELGSFLSPDPLLAYDSWNMYQYGLAAPGTWSDPLGLGVGAYVGGFAVGLGTGVWDIVAGFGGTAWDLAFNYSETVGELKEGIGVLKDALLDGDVRELADILSGGLVERFEDWDTLSDYEQGELIGETAAALGATAVSAAGLGKLAKKIKKARAKAKKNKKNKKKKDEDKDKCKEAPSGNSTGKSRKELSDAGKKPVRGGLTAAGRSYQKHMDRGELPHAGGKDFDRVGQKLLDDILNDKDTKFSNVTGGRAIGGTMAIRPDGAGAVFFPNGSLAYFGEF